MGRCIIKIQDRYFDWSSIVDAPVTYAMTEEQLRRYVRREYGEQGLRDLPSMLERIAVTGTSAQGYTLNQIIAGNRAGPNETRITADQIYERFLKPAKEGG